VLWLQEALDELTNLWMQAESPVRQHVTNAAHRLDQELQTDPFTRSESRDGEERVIFVNPLAALIEVDEGQGIAWILHVWRFR
jgi:hypothetical protein